MIKNAERVGKRECVIPSSKLIKKVVEILKKNGYVEDYEIVKEGKFEKIKVKLKGKIIDINVIKPRFSVKVTEFEKWEKRFLPARDFGLLIVTTPKGLMTHKKAIKSGIGGKLICYVY